MNVLENIRTQIKAKLDERTALQATLDEVIAGTEGRSELTEDETKAFAEARDAVTTLDESLTPLQAREAELAAVEASRAVAEATAQRVAQAPASPAPAGTTQVRVGEEELTYRKNGAHNFLQDAYLSQRGDFAAQDRIRRHTQEMGPVEERGTPATTATFGGLIPPMYLLDLFAPLARAGRPLANTIRNVPLPPHGMSAVIPKISTGTTIGAQTNQGDALSEGSIAETDITPVVKTAGGYQTVSRQSLERGTLVEEIVFADLAAEYAVQLDTAVITALLATSSIEAVTYTDASPTLPELFPKIADAIQRVNSKRYMPATVVFMHPRRWGWMLASLDGSSRPLVTGEAPQNPVGTGVAAKYGQIVGQILGVPVVTDANFSTAVGAGTEDTILVAKADDAILWEENGGVPRQLSFDQPLGINLEVQLAVYGYYMFNADRYPKSFAKINGTGLIAPTF